MSDSAVSPAIASFITSVAEASSRDAVWLALQKLAQATVGVKLFTVMTVDLEQDLARRAYSSDTVNYPVSGTKPIHRDQWFAIVHDAKRSFVANTIEDIATVFPDFELIKSLGCGSVVNLPVVLKGKLAATINMLHATNHFTPERVAMAEQQLKLPAMLAVLAAHALPEDTR